MKILLVAYQFPPYSNIGSLRVGKLAQYLHNQGHDVRVLAANKIPLPATMELEIPAERVTYTRWFNVNFLPELFFGGQSEIVSKGYKTKSSFLKKLGYVYRLLLNFPDERIGWYPFAVSAGMKMLKGWRADVIYASQPSPTAFMVANRLSARTGIPWVAEYRDLWAVKGHYEYPEWRRKIEKRLERIVLRSAAGIVTVSEIWARRLGEEHNKTVGLAMNGFVPEDYPADFQPDWGDPRQLNIVYTGTVHADIVDAQPLFDALALLGDDARRVNLIFYTRYVDMLMRVAAPLGLEGRIQHRARVPYVESLRQQMQADALLYFVPMLEGIIFAKVFEYLGARRPILGVGNPESLSSRMIITRGAGTVSRQAEDIAAMLRAWLGEKERHGMIASLPEEARAGLSRDGQFAEVVKFLTSLLAGEKA